MYVFNELSAAGETHVGSLAAVGGWGKGIDQGQNAGWATYACVFSVVHLGGYEAQKTIKGLCVPAQAILVHNVSARLRDACLRGRLLKQRGRRTEKKTNLQRGFSHGDLWFLSASFLVVFFPNSPWMLELEAVRATIADLELRYGRWRAVSRWW